MGRMSYIGDTAVRHTDGTWTYELARGDVAFIDSFRGLVPVRIVSVRHDRDTADPCGFPTVTGNTGTVYVRVTANRPGYDRGEIVGLSYNPMTGAAPLSLVSRDSVYVRAGQYRISGMPTNVRADVATFCKVCGGSWHERGPFDSDRGIVHMSVGCSGAVRGIPVGLVA